MFKVHESHIDGWTLKFDELANFSSLRKAYEYVDLLVKGSNGKLNHYSFTITEVKYRKWYERKLFSKKPFNKTYEHVLRWNEICYWLDNHLVD